MYATCIFEGCKKGADAMRIFENKTVLVILLIQYKGSRPVFWASVTVSVTVTDFRGLLTLLCIRLALRPSHLLGKIRFLRGLTTKCLRSVLSFVDWDWFLLRSKGDDQ